MHNCERKQHDVGWAEFFDDISNMYLIFYIMLKILWQVKCKILKLYERRFKTELKNKAKLYLYV